MLVDTNISTQNNVKPGNTTITEHKIGKITYLVVASHSATATDTAKRKIEKLIQRECSRMAN